MPRQYSVQRGRGYIHRRCGSETVISGRHFVGLCNPFAPCSGTICMECGPDSTKNFVWADTGESVSRYRRRLRRASPGLTALNWLVAPAIGALIGAIALSGVEGPNLSSTVASAVGAVVGILLMVLFIAPILTGLIVGKRFYQQR